MTEQDTAHPPRLCLTLWLLGLISALSLLAAPLETLAPASLALPWWAVRLLSLINPVVLTTVLVAVGCWATRRVGLGAPLIAALLAGRPALPVLRRQAGPAVVAGVAVAAVLAGYAVLTAPLFAAAPKLPDLAMPLVTKLLYGGVVEELMMRWGLMSLCVWLAWRALRVPAPSTAAFLIGNLVAAVVFAAGHLPLLYVMLPQPPAALIVAVLIGNAVPGLLFGWLFWRRGLEAAMLAHALAHLLFTLVSAAS